MHFQAVSKVAGFGNCRNFDLYTNGSELAAQAPGSRGDARRMASHPDVSGSDYLWGSYFCFSFVAALRLSLPSAWLGLASSPLGSGRPSGLPAVPPSGCGRPS